MMVGLAAENGEEKTAMLDATYLKARWTATSMGFKNDGADAWAVEKSAAASRRLRQPMALAGPVRYPRADKSLHWSTGADW